MYPQPQQGDLFGEQEATFLRRTRSIYHAQRGRAVKSRQQVSYGLDQLRQLVRHKLRTTDCAYCGTRLGVTAFSLDHATPVSRGGSWELANVVVCCESCNLAKGALTGPEFSGLLDLLKTWPPRAQTDLLRRLKASWRVLKKGG